MLKKSRQQQQETVIMYAERLWDLASDAFPGEDINQLLIAGELVQVFVDGLRSNSIARRVLPEGPATFERAITCATQEQRMLDRFRLRNRVEEPMEVDRLAVDKKRLLTCFNCGEQGHMAKECSRSANYGGPKGQGIGANKGQPRQREKLCWTCGEPAHIARDCPLKGGN